MDFSSWIRTALLRKNKSDQSNPSSSQTEPNLKQREVKEAEEEEELGVTDELKDFVKSLSAETFKNFPLQQDDNQVRTVNGSDNIQKDLSEWQERHAMLVLTKVKEISLLRYVLCPRYLKDRQFWQIYFMLVKNYVSPFELLAIRKAKLRRMAVDDGNLVESPAYEVEMAEAKQSRRSLPSESDVGSV
ncbi:hypothetical protein C5167_015454 [Papaver somniferum]|uniref:BSD domain-containing protein n=1 Tax=Papaver somniferum TaxID=3469 RepID=A0A4Y7JA42_PAPSO|nr:uncharacterized protein LOC113358534 [Papaver somniferum]RZC56599.1 hypothetical protein C5167_015454 [Papaver somniferum]